MSTVFRPGAALAALALVILAGCAAPASSGPEVAAGAGPTSAAQTSAAPMAATPTSSVPTSSVPTSSDAVPTATRQPPTPGGAGYRMGDAHTPGPGDLTYAPVPRSTRTATLTVVHHQVDCCYAEGSFSYLVLRNSPGNVVFWREFQAGTEPVTAMEATLPPGQYTVQTFQRPCDANCGFVDPPDGFCEKAIRLDAGESLALTERFSVRSGCRFIES